MQRPSSARRPNTAALRLGAWLVLVLSAAFFLTTGGTYPGIASVEAHVIGQIIAIAVLGGWCAYSLVRPSWRPTSPLMLPIALAAAAYLASAVFSQRPRLSFEPTIAGLGWALAFLFLSRLLGETWFRARVVVVMTAFVGVVAFGYIGQVIIEWVKWWGLVGHFAVPPLRPSFVALWLGSPNLIATALLLLAPLVVAIAWSRARGRTLAIALAVAAALAVFLSGSRGAYLGVGAGAVIALVLAVTRAGGLRAGVGVTVSRFRTRPVLLLPVAAVVTVGLVLAPSLLLRFAQGGGTLRVDLWKSALTIFTEHPILGAGPGTWVQLKVAANPAGVPNLILPHAHDMYVQAAAEVGVLGLLALAVLAFAVLRWLWTAWRSTDRAVSLHAGAVLVSLAAFAAQSIVDNLVNLPLILLIVVAVVAWVDGGAMRGDPGSVETSSQSPVVRRLSAAPWATAIVPALGILAFAMLVPTLLRIDRAAALSREGNDAPTWQQSLDAYSAARDADPGFTMYEIQEAGALAQLGRTAEARDLLARAVESDPVAINVIGLAALEADLGDRDAALAHIREAAALGSGEPFVALNAGLLAQQLGDLDLALDQFANAIAWDPPLAGSSSWASTARAIPLSRIVERARTRVDPLDGALVLAYGGDPVGARTELEALSGSPQRDAYIAATVWLGGDPAAAIANLESRMRSDPSDYYSAGWLARIAYLSGDAATGDRYAGWAIAVQGDSALGIVQEMSRVPTLDRSSNADLPGTYPWAVYLRPTTLDLVMPQLTTIGLR